MARVAKLRIWRGDATGGQLRDYDVPWEEGMVLLDVLHVLQATQAGDLAVRWNCKAGKCGSCSAEVNGKPRLMCMTRMSSLDTSAPITVAPMKTVMTAESGMPRPRRPFRSVDVFPVPAGPPA